jgi:hypothetical protein
VSQAHIVLLPLLAVVVAPGCRKAPPAEEIPIDMEALTGDVTVYSAFHSHVEILQPAIDAMVATSDEYVAGGTDECFRVPDLTPCDLAEMRTQELDPTGIASVAHAQVMDAPTSSFEALFPRDDWEDVYPGTFLDYEIVEDTGLEAWAAGEQDLCTFTYGCAVDAILDQVSYYNVSHLRRIPDWNGTGQPVLLLRGYLPEPGIANTDTTTLDQQYSLEIYTPTEDGSQTLRTLISWSAMKIGDLEISDAFNMACGNYKKNFDNLETWMTDEGL